jgi:hypothetical protein
MPMLMMAMFQEIKIAVPYAIVGSVVSIAGVYAATFLATSKANARSQGVIETKIAEGFKRFNDDVARLEQTDRDQWKKIDKIDGEIGELGQRTARLEGRANGRAHGASAGA